VLGLIILGIVSSIVVSAEMGSAIQVGSILQTTAIAIGFLVGAMIIGVFIMPKFLSFMTRFKSKGVMITSALILCFVLSYSANLAGLATIVGAFAAGLILEELHFKGFKEDRTMHELLTPVTTLLVPVFFVLMGIQVRLETFGNLSIIGVALGLTAAAVLGKQICGLAVVEKGLDRLSIGIGMIPRGEVGLIFASIGKSLNVINNTLFSAIVIMVILTTLITPPLLKLSLGRYKSKTI
jgi:Kef-type K+ transport system membrane component KefB